MDVCLSCSCRLISLPRERATTARQHAAATRSLPFDASDVCCGHRLSVIPRALVDRSNPPPDSDDDEGDECIEYDVYGWFKFESDADGVQRLDRQWVPLHDLEQAEG